MLPARTNRATAQCQPHAQLSVLRTVNRSVVSETGSTKTIRTRRLPLPWPARLPAVRWLLVAVAVGLAGGAVWLFARERSPGIYGYRVIETYPHDGRAYCQGLVIADGELYEGTGRKGQSTLRRVDLETGRVLQQHALDRRHFGEGITVLDDRIYQLTWKAGICYVYDRETFREIKRFRYDGEGWGLTHDGTHLIMSDGSSRLQFRDPETFQVVRRAWVRSSGRAVTNLNELEFVEGEILANVWRKDYIARIDPRSGNVHGWIDLSNLYPPRQRRDREHVLNGIAYDADARRLFVTGKNWPKLYEIRVVGRR